MFTCKSVLLSRWPEISLLGHKNNLDICLLPLSPKLSECSHSSADKTEVLQNCSHSLIL